MADVAEALGVAKGTLYGYVESKAALFDAAIRYADRHESLPEAAELPIETPAPGVTVKRLRDRIAEEAADLRLVQARGRPNQRPMSPRSFAKCSSTSIVVQTGIASPSSSLTVARLTIPTSQRCGSVRGAGHNTSSWFTTFGVVSKPGSCVRFQAYRSPLALLSRP